MRFLINVMLFSYLFEEKMESEVLSRKPLADDPKQDFEAAIPLAETWIV